MIASITVTYQPDMDLLRRQLGSLQSQVQQIIVIDNGTTRVRQGEIKSTVDDFGGSVIFVGVNSGIAHAQNVGIQQAMSRGADMVLLLDQDSEACPAMVESLRKALDQEPHAAAAGPRSIDQRTGHSFFLVDDGRWPRQRVYALEQHHPPVKVGFLVASGTLIRVAALDGLTPMQSNWFIDHVDSEWCLRVQSKGWLLLGVPDAHLKHRLGDEVTKVWFLGWRTVAHHSPLRDYYMFRNTVLLVKRPYVSLRWKLFFLSRLVQVAGFFVLLTPQRLKRLQMMCKGVADGIFNRTGPWK